MLFTHINPPAGTRGYEIERAAVNVIAPRTDKRGTLFLTDEMLIYHGSSFSFHIFLHDITLHEASAGIFESPFIKLTFQDPDKDVSGTVKLNFKSGSFDAFASAFPIKYARARQEALQEPRRSIVTTDYTTNSTNTIKEKPNTSPPAPSALSPYPGLQAAVGTMGTSNDSQKAQKQQQQPYTTPPVVAPTSPTPINEWERRPLLEDNNTESAILQPNRPRKDNQGFNTIYESTWGVVYNPKLDPKKDQEDDQGGITQCLPPVMNYSS